MSERRNVGVNLRRVVGVGMTEQGLRGALVDAGMNAHRLEGLAEAMECHRAAQLVAFHDAGLH